MPDNLTNPGQPPQEGDQMMELQGNLKIYWTHGESKESEEDKARAWRDLELQSSDWIMPITDHPQHTAYKNYRAALRDWPTAKDADGNPLFPNTRPELGT